jgi:hypothetical protein
MKSGNSNTIEKGHPSSSAAVNIDEILAHVKKTGQAYRQLNTKLSCFAS